MDSIPASKPPVDSKRAADAKPMEQTQSGGVSRWVERAVIAFGSFGVGLLSNHISGDPRVMYITAGTTSLLLAWFIVKKGVKWRLIAGVIGVLIVTPLLFWVANKWVTDEEASKKSEVSDQSVQRDTVKRLGARWAPTNPPTKKQFEFLSHLVGGRNWMPPELAPGNLDFVEIKMAATIERSTPIRLLSKSFVDGLQIRDDHIFPIVPYIMSNRVYLLAFTPFGRQAKTLYMNDDWVQLNQPGWDKNFDDTSFEIVDDNWLPVFQVRYRSPSRIEAYGIFLRANRTVQVAFGNTLSTDTSGHIPEIRKGDRKAWFKYPSSSHPAERAGE